MNPSPQPFSIPKIRHRGGGMTFAFMVCEKLERSTPAFPGQLQSRQSLGGCHRQIAVLRTFSGNTFPWKLFRQPVVVDAASPRRLPAPEPGASAWTPSLRICPM